MDDKDYEKLLEVKERRDRDLRRAGTLPLLLIVGAIILGFSLVECDGDDDLVKAWAFCQEYIDRASVYGAEFRGTGPSFTDNLADEDKNRFLYVWQVGQISQKQSLRNEWKDIGAECSGTLHPFEVERLVVDGVVVTIEK